MNRIIETEMIGIRKEVCFGHVEYKLIYIVNRISIVKKKKTQVKREEIWDLDEYFVFRVIGFYGSSIRFPNRDSLHSASQELRLLTSMVGI